MKHKNPWRFCGFDEFNQGRYPEIDVLAFSSKEKDVERAKGGLFNKIRSHGAMNERLVGRDYRFLMLKREEMEYIRAKDWKQKMPAIILGSLLLNVEIEEPLEIFYDGVLSKFSVDYARDVIKDLKSISKESFRINFGRNYDKRIYLVNLADEIAHSIYRGSLEDISKDSRMVPLRLDLIPITSK